MNIHVWVFVRNCYEWNRWIICVFYFLNNCQTFPKCEWVFNFCTLSWKWKFVIHFFIFSHSTICEVVCHCSFDLHFLTNNVKHHLMWLMGICKPSLGYSSFYIELWTLFIKSGYKFLIRYGICKYFLPISTLSFYFFYDVLWSTKFSFDEVLSISILFFCWCAYGVVSKTSLPNQVIKDICYSEKYITLSISCWT